MVSALRIRIGMIRTALLDPVEPPCLSISILSSKSSTNLEFTIPVGEAEAEIETFVCRKNHHATEILHQIYAASHTQYVEAKQR